MQTFGGSDEVVVQLSDVALPPSISIDGGSPTTNDRVEVRGNVNTEDRLTLSGNTIRETNTGQLITLSQVEAVEINVAGDLRDDLVTVERDFKLASDHPTLNVVGDHQAVGQPAVDRLIVNTEPTRITVTSQLFSAAGFSFDQASTPDQLTHLSGGTGVVETIPDGINDARIDNLAFATSTAATFPDSSVGFDGSLSIGRLSDKSTGTSARFLNMPGGDNGTSTRSVFELTWSQGRQLANSAGTDFVLFESGSAGVPEAIMVQVRQTSTQENGGWSDWVYLPATAFTNGVFATAFDLSQFGVANGATIDAIRVANMIDTDRMESATELGS